jgi:hypothetical protein
MKKKRKRNKVVTKKKQTEKIRKIKNRGENQKKKREKV